MREANTRLSSSFCLQCQIDKLSSNSLFHSFYAILTTEGNYQRGSRHGRRAPNGQREEEDDQVQRQERAEDDEETWRNSHMTF